MPARGLKSRDRLAAITSEPAHRVIGFGGNASDVGLEPHRRRGRRIGSQTQCPLAGSRPPWRACLTSWPSALSLSSPFPAACAADSSALSSPGTAKILQRRYLPTASPHRPHPDTPGSALHHFQSDVRIATSLQPGCPNAATTHAVLSDHWTGSVSTRRSGGWARSFTHGIDQRNRRDAPRPASGRRATTAGWTCPPRQSSWRITAGDHHGS
jgi:hypothetical protein